MRLRCFTLAAAILVAACHSPTAPNEGVNSTTEPHGRLSGTVTIGPNCPVETESQPCPTSPDAYRARKILIYNSDHSSLLFTVDIDSQGAFLIDLVPATYVVDLKGAGIDRTGDLPKTVTIQANVVTTLTVNIDTGLR